MVKTKGTDPNIRAYMEPATFTGKVLLYTTSNLFIRGSIYENGVLVSEIKPKEGVIGTVGLGGSLLKSYIAVGGEDDQTLPEVIVVGHYPPPPPPPPPPYFPPPPPPYYPPPPPPPYGGGGGTSSDDYNFQSNHGKMCGSYNWGTIGNAWYTEFKSAGFSLVNRNGQFINFEYGTPCIQFAKSSVFTTSQANKAWNDAWNYAVDAVLKSVNGGGPRDNNTFRTTMTGNIKYFINKHYPNSTFNPTGCYGDVPRSEPKYCH